MLNFKNKTKMKNTNKVQNTENTQNKFKARHDEITSWAMMKLNYFASKHIYPDAHVESIDDHYLVFKCKDNQVTYRFYFANELDTENSTPTKKVYNLSIEAKVDSMNLNIADQNSNAFFYFEHLQMFIRHQKQITRTISTYLYNIEQNYQEFFKSL